MGAALRILADLTLDGLDVVLREDRVRDRLLLHLNVTNCASVDYAHHGALLLHIVFAEVQQADANLTDIHVGTLSPGRPAIARDVRRLVRAERKLVVILREVSHTVARDW